MHHSTVRERKGIKEYLAPTKQRLCKFLFNIFIWKLWYLFSNIFKQDYKIGKLMISLS